MSTVVDYTNLIGLVTITPEQLYNVEDAAKAMTKEECMAFTGVTLEGLTEIEALHLEGAYKRGRLKGKKLASDRLFSQMGMKGGGAVALAYLEKFGEEFKTDGTEGNKVFSFSVKLDG
jgi:hypothetical protein